MGAESVVISIGHTRKFSLQSSAGTGYVWMLAELPQGAWLEGVEDSGAGGPGGPSTRTFSLFGAKEGAGTLRFVLARPWEPLSIAEQRDYSVRVHSGTVVVPLYAAALQQAKASGDTARMRELVAQAEQQLGSSAEIQAALADVKAVLGKEQHIEKHEGKGAVPAPLYAVAIQKAAASGDFARMKAVAAQAEALPDQSPEIKSALVELKAHMAKAKS